MAQMTRSDIVLNLFFPHLKIGFITIDPAKMPILGLNVSDILQPLEVAPRRKVAGAQHSWSVFRVGLPEDQGLDFPIPVVGAIGFQNDGGLLRLTTNTGIANELSARWGQHIEVPARHVPGVGVQTWFRVEPGLEASWEIPKAGPVIVAHPDTPDPK